MIQTEPCPAKADGSAHRCFGCSEPIAAGAPVLDFGPRHGYQHYPSCDGASSPTAAVAALDNGDRVAIAMGLMPSPATPTVQHAATAHASRTAAPTPQTLDNADLVCAAMGLTVAPAATRDLGDRVADLLCGPDRTVASSPIESTAAERAAPLTRQRLTTESSVARALALTSRSPDALADAVADRVELAVFGRIVGRAP